MKYIRFTLNHTLQIAWFKDGINLTALVSDNHPSAARYQILNSNLLEVENAFPNDTGSYMCVATSGDEKDNKTAKLVVEGKICLIIRSKGKFQLQNWLSWLRYMFFL